MQPREDATELGGGLSRDFAPIDFERELNDEQYAAVSAQAGPALVLAGAGSGKTRTLTYRVAWLLHQGVQPWQILLLTFTNKAAREMLNRVEDLTGVKGHQFWGGTFHAVGLRMLRIHGESVGLSTKFTVLDESESESLLKDAIQGVDPQFLKSKNNPKPRVISDMISYARNTLRPVDEVVRERYPFYENLAPVIQRFFVAFQERKQAQKVVNYDDLLEYWLQLMERDEEVAGRYQNRFRHILVDEYQDTNPLQAKIVDKLAAHHQVMAVGDDAQCIYTWRGADFKNIMTFSDRHPGTQLYKIETNYRSTPEILNFANGVLTAQPLGFGYSKNLRPVRTSRELPVFIPVMDTRQQAKVICSRIRELYDEGHGLREIAVLYRAHYHAMDLQTELSHQGIPYTITSGVRFFEQAHIKDIAAHLRLVENPVDMSAWSRIVTLLPKVGAVTSDKLFRFVKERAETQKRNFFEVLVDPAVEAKVPKGGREHWDALASSLLDLWKASREKPPPEVVRVAIDGWYGVYLRTAYPNWSERMEDLEGLVGFARQYEDLNDMLAQLVLLASETSDRSVEPDEDKLRLTTVHQAKGLEFPVVFVIGLADGLFPLRRAIEADDIEEERRLFYVSVTRAQDELYLTYPMISSGGGPPQRQDPSRFIKEVSTQYFETVRMRSSW